MGDDLFFLDSKKEAEHWKRCAAWLADCHAATTQTLAEIKGTSKYELRRHQAIVQKAAALLRGIELPGTLGTDAARVAARCDDAAERCERRLSPER